MKRLERHNTNSPGRRDTAFRLWLLSQQFERRYRAGADSQELIVLMNRIKALEERKEVLS